MPKIQFDPDEDLIDPCYDNVFKAIFTRDSPNSRGALSDLISVLADRPLKVDAIIANEPAVEDLRDRQLRFDVNCREVDGGLVNVEMSLNPDSFEPARLEFYAGKLFTGQDIRGSHQGYNNLHPAWQMAILGNRRFFPDDAVLHSFEYYDTAHGIRLGGKTRIITLELKKMEEVVKKPVKEMSTAEQWGVFFEYLTDKSKREKINEILMQEEGIAMAGDVLMTISRDDAERARLMSEYKYQLDMQSHMVHAERKGIEKGRVEGRVEGRWENMTEIVRNCKAIGTPVSQIVRITGLTEQQINEL